MRMTCSCKATLCEIYTYYTPICYSEVQHHTSSHRHFPQAPHLSQQRLCLQRKWRKNQNFLHDEHTMKMDRPLQILQAIQFWKYSNSKLSHQPCECDSWGQQRDSRLGAYKVAWDACTMTKYVLDDIGLNLDSVIGIWDTWKIASCQKKEKKLGILSAILKKKK